MIGVPVEIVLWMVADLRLELPAFSFPPLQLFRGDAPGVHYWNLFLANGWYRRQAVERKATDGHEFQDFPA